MNRRPTINDVAAASGVSKSTVSNVVRGTGVVSADTRERVLAAVASLGYRPNAAARELVRGRTHLIGVVVGNLANSFDAELVKHIEEVAADAAYTTLVCNTGGRPELEGARIEALLEQRVDGIALLDFSGDRGVLSQLLATRVPAVMVSCWADYADCVAVDDVEGIELAVGHLVQLGHREIAHVVDPVMEATTRRARIAGFERSLLRHGLAVRPEWVGSSVPAGATAVVAANDYTALAVIESLEGRGIPVPAQVSVVGFDGIEIGGLRRMALTTVAQPGFELARRGVELLLRRIDRGHDAPPEQQRLAPRLIVRGSTRSVSGA